MTDVHPLLDGAFRTLDAFGVRWCLLRGRARLGAPEGDVDLLVAPTDEKAARAALRRAGFVPLRRWPGGSQAFFLGYDRETDRWIYVHAVTQLDFGPWHGVRFPGGVTGVLNRLESENEIPMPSANDRFWLTLLHALLDKGHVASKHREALADLSVHARPDGELGGFVGERLPGDTGAAEVIAAASAREWSLLEELAPKLSAAAHRADRRSGWRRRFHHGSVLALKLREIVTRRGVATAILAPDGAGKSTVINSLERALFFRVKHYYLGLEGGIFAGRERSRIPGMGLLRRVGHAWSVWLRSQADLARRRFVLFDRYPYEALLPPSEPLGRLSRWRRALLARSLPPPNLVVVLDAPGSVLHARKGEHTAERLERDRRGYLELALRRPGWTVIDASRPPLEVRRDVTEAIWRAYSRRFASR